MNIIIIELPKERKEDEKVLLVLAFELSSLLFFMCELELVYVRARV